MTVMKSMFTILLAAIICFSQINISGKVTDTSGVTPLSGAFVNLEKLGLTFTTGADGNFWFTATGVLSNNNHSQSRKLTANTGNGLLYIHLQERSLVEIINYTISGKAVSRVQQVMETGAHSIAQPNMGNGINFYKIKAGNNELILKSPLIGRGAGFGAGGVTGITATVKTSRAERFAPVTSTLKVTSVTNGALRN
jgi:hypothetical protein